MGMTKAERVLEALRQNGRPTTPGELIGQLGYESPHALAKPLARLVKQGRIRRVSHGVYTLVDTRTLSEATGIEVRREVRPVNAGVTRPVELRPQNGEDRTIPLLLEVVARAPDPKPYAGIVQEIGRMLSA